MKSFLEIKAILDDLEQEVKTIRENSEDQSAAWTDWRSKNMTVLLADNADIFKKLFRRFSRDQTNKTFDDYYHQILLPCAQIIAESDSQKSAHQFISNSLELTAQHSAFQFYLFNQLLPSVELCKSDIECVIKEPENTPFSITTLYQFQPNTPLLSQNLAKVFMSALGLHHATLVRFMLLYLPNEWIANLAYGDDTRCIQRTVDTLKAVTNPEFYTHHMLSLTAGLGRLKVDNGYFVAACIQSIKFNPMRHPDARYFYNPVILDTENNEHLKFYDILYDIKQPCSIVFVGAGIHWFTGLFERNQQGEVKIFVFDSVGDESVHIGLHIGSLHDLFENKASLYYSKTVLQNTDIGCSMMSLLIAKELYTVQRYLPGPYPQNTLFSYLEAQHQRMVMRDLDRSEIDYFPFLRLTELPLRMLRFMQSRRLYMPRPDPTNSSAYLPSFISRRSQEEQKLPVNKKYHTAIQSSTLFFVPGEEGRLQNRRIEYKQAAFIHQAIHFLTTRPECAIRESMNTFTYDAFYARVERENLLQADAPLPEPRSISPPPRP